MGLGAMGRAEGRLGGKDRGTPWSFSLLMLSVEEKEDVAAGSEPSGWGTRSLADPDCTLIRKHQPDNWALQATLLIVEARHTKPIATQKGQ